MTAPSDAPLYGLIEAGGTKFILGIARGPHEVIAQHRIATTQPDETLTAAIDWLRCAAPAGLTAVGISSFGPLDLDRASPRWGHVRPTPKPGWSDADLVGPFARAFGCPVAIDTDVNGAALAESRWGAGRDQRVTIYLTIGTGVGGGAVIDGQLLHGLSHPEMGHFRVPRHPDDRDFAGHCRFHGDCLEGLACGPAIIARWGASLSALGADHRGHDIIAWYLAQAVQTLQAIFEPGRIIFGGGVMATPGLLDRVRAQARALGSDYFVGDPAALVVAPGLGDRAGLLGALALALSV